MRATLFLLLFGIAPLANAAGMMDTLVSQVQSASGGWIEVDPIIKTDLIPV